MTRPRAVRRERRVRRGTIPPDLYGYARPCDRKAGRPIKHNLTDWHVVDDWPERVPVTDREIDVFEAWFGDILDELFGPK